MNILLGSKIKIGIILFIAFIVVKTISVAGVFLGNTPRVSPIFIARIKNGPHYIASFPSVMLDKLRNSIRIIPQTTQDNLVDRSNNSIDTDTTTNRRALDNPIPQKSQTRPTQKQQSPYIIPTSVPPVDLEYKPVSRGVYAAQDKNTNKTFVKIEKGTKFKAVSKTINGRQIRLMIPEKL